LSKSHARRSVLSAGPIPHHYSRAAFPLGGIGTGNVSLGARGELRDWEIENQPAKGRTNPYSFFSIHAKPADGGVGVTRVLEAVSTTGFDTDTGLLPDVAGGLPRLRGATLRGSYPVAAVDFADDVLPVEVSLRAFTPLVPLDADASSIPAAVLRYSVHNPQRTAVTVSVIGTFSHTVGNDRRSGGPRPQQTVQWEDGGDVRGLSFGVELPHDDPNYGTLCLATTDESVTARVPWAPTDWPDELQRFWRDVEAGGSLEAPPAAEFTQSAADGPHSAAVAAMASPLRTASLGIVHRIEPGATTEFEFVLSWCFPNRIASWQGELMPESAAPGRVRNHYASIWPDAWSAAAHTLRSLEGLERATLDFTEALYEGSLDPAVAESVGANIAALRSTTCFVLDSPSPALGAGPVFAAWEGSFASRGSCEGTCTHVWMYAQTAAWLFPSLERSARRVEFLLETDAAGAQRFRTNGIFGGPPWPAEPAVDGQLGSIIRLYREWRFCGDDDFLRELWPAARRCLDYAISHWDLDGDGLLDARMHNTFDIEFSGPEPRANLLLIAALRASITMALHVGDGDAAARWTAQETCTTSAMASLWNGRYFVQRPIEGDSLIHQYGAGLLSDQLLGQFLAYVAGLGDLVPRSQIESALRTIVSENFLEDVGTLASGQRVFAGPGESGMILASWPDGGRPDTPFFYSDEVWSGVEHQVATTLAYVGMTEEATAVERAVRARHTGERRSPWNEIECGNHYARSLASWGLLLAFSGAQWDATARVLSFNPTQDGRYVFTTDSAWGRVEIDSKELRLTVLGGQLRLAELVVGDAIVASDVILAADGIQSGAQLRTQLSEV
jgi:non-lysosomal glucosylceramidase